MFFIGRLRMVHFQVVADHKDLVPRLIFQKPFQKVLHQVGVHDFLVKSEVQTSCVGVGGNHVDMHPLRFCHENRDMSFRSISAHLITTVLYSCFVHPVDNSLFLLSLLMDSGKLLRHPLFNGLLILSRSLFYGLLD